MDRQGAKLVHYFLHPACVQKPNSATYDYIVRELAPTEHEPDEAPINIVCEPLGVSGGVNARGTITMMA